MENHQTRFLHELKTVHVAVQQMTRGVSTPAEVECLAIPSSSVRKGRFSVTVISGYAIIILPSGPSCEIQIGHPYRHLTVKGESLNTPK